MQHYLKSTAGMCLHLVNALPNFELCLTRTLDEASIEQLPGLLGPPLGFCRGLNGCFPHALMACHIFVLNGPDYIRYPVMVQLPEARKVLHFGKFAQDGSDKLHILADSCEDDLLAIKGQQPWDASLNFEYSVRSRQAFSRLPMTTMHWASCTCLCFQLSLRN